MYSITSELMKMSQRCRHTLDAVNRYFNHQLFTLMSVSEVQPISAAPADSLRDSLNTVCWCMVVNVNVKSSVVRRERYTMSGTRVDSSVIKFTSKAHRCRVPISGARFLKGLQGCRICAL